MKTLEMDIGEATKHMTLTVNLRLRGVRMYQARLKVASWLLRLTAWMMMCDLDLKGLSFHSRLSDES